jgi:hypothetical protein
VIVPVSKPKYCPRFYFKTKSCARGCTPPPLPARLLGLKPANLWSMVPPSDNCHHELRRKH